jgi:hypothetical protein
MGWQDNLTDPGVYPPQFADSHFKGTGRSIENELYFNAARKPPIESPKGIFAKHDYFDTTVMEDVG